MDFDTLYQICVDFWKQIFKAMRLPTGGQEVCTSLALKDTSPRCRTCCLGNSSMFKSPMATFSKELEAIRNVPVHPLSAAAWWLTYGYCMLKSLCVRHACTRRRVQARLCARQRAAFVLAFSLFLFFSYCQCSFLRMPWQSTEKKTKKDIWKWSAWALFKNSLHLIKDLVAIFRTILRYDASQRWTPVP